MSPHRADGNSPAPEKAWPEHADAPKAACIWALKAIVVFYFYWRVNTNCKMPDEAGLRSGRPCGRL